MKNHESARTLRAILLTAALLFLLPALLAGCGGTGEAETEANPSESGGTGVYTVRLSEAVAGFSFTFCTGDVCVPVTTGADGTAVYEGPEAEYEVKLIRSADGYEADFPEERLIGPESGEIFVEVSEAAS